MRTGLQEVKESIDRAKAKSSGSNTGRGLNYFSFKSGEKKIVRALAQLELREAGVRLKS